MAALNVLPVRHCWDYPSLQGQAHSVTSATLLPGRLIS